MQAMAHHRTLGYCPPMSGSQAQNNGSGDGEQFGFTPVAEGERQRLVNQVFSRVAGRYDLMNDLMSGGLHRLWKDDMIAWLAPPRGAGAFHLLDVAGGTGDIAARYLETAGPEAKCTICDISTEMLGVARDRFASVEPARLRLLIGDASALPVSDGAADAYTIAFGIRNVTHIEDALSEAFRVLKPGGRFLCLEFSHVNVPLLDTLYEQYSFNAIPALGGLVAGDRDSYKYLVESIRKFPDQEDFAGMIRKAGFEQVRYRDLTGGIAAIHSGWKL